MPSADTNGNADQPTTSQTPFWFICCSSHRTRLAVAWGLVKQQQIPFDDLEPFVAELKATWNVAGHRLQHIDNAPPDQEWEPAVA